MLSMWVWGGGVCERILIHKVLHALMPLVECELMVYYLMDGYHEVSNCTFLCDEFERVPVFI